MNELTDSEFWAGIWKHNVDLSRYDNEKWVFRNYMFRHFHQICQKHLIYDPEKEFLDVGCGVGDWSVYFHRAYGFKVSALDTSTLAIRQAKQNFDRQKIKANIMLEDFFDHQGRYDVVYAGGFLEHFRDPEPVLVKMYSLLKPGGVLINWIPNLEGRTGFVLRMLDSSVFETHNVLKDDQLLSRHSAAGFAETKIYYNGSICLGMLPMKKMNRMLRLMLKVTAKGINCLCLCFGILFCCLESRRISPFKVVVAHKGTQKP